MPRYIDADALIISLAKDRSALVNNHVPHGELHRIDETIWKVVEAPTIDAVPVVRCGECAKQFMPDCPLQYIEKHEQRFICQKDDDFCSYGAKMEDKP